MNSKKNRFLGIVIFLIAFSLVIEGCYRYRFQDSEMEEILQSNFDAAQIVVTVLVVETNNLKQFFDDNNNPGYEEFVVKAKILNILKTDVHLDPVIYYHYTSECDLKNSSGIGLDKNRLVFLKKIGKTFWCLNESSQFNLDASVQGWMKRFK